MPPKTRKYKAARVDEDGNVIKPAPQLYLPPPMVRNGKPRGKVAPPGFIAKQFKPGVGYKGPRGDRKLEAEVRRIAQHYSVAGLYRLVSIMLDEGIGSQGEVLGGYVKHNDIRASTVAAEKVLERAWGKPKEMEIEETKLPKPDLGDLGPEDLADLRRIARKLQNKPEEEDA